MKKSVLLLILSLGFVVNAFACNELTITNAGFSKKSVYVYASSGVETWLAASFGLAANTSTTLDTSDSWGVTYTVYYSDSYGGKHQALGYGCDYTI